jgi:hypothetical protein
MGQKEWFEKARAESGKSFDKRKCCIWFEGPDDLAPEVSGEAIRRVPAKQLIQSYLAVLNRTPAQGRRLEPARKKRGL